MPIPFTCPHCGARTEVDERYAGQSGPCSQCGQTIVVPLPGGRAAPPRTGSRNNTSLIIVLVLVGACLVCAVPGVLVGLLLPAVQAAREAARRSQCSNNLKQISLAMLNYHDMYKAFPPAYVTDANGKRLHTWRVLILPYMEEQALYDAYDLKEPWDGPNNSRLAGRMPLAYRCPSSSAAGQTTTNYVAIVGPETVLKPEQSATQQQLQSTDGTANTILVVEGSQAVNWMEPRDLDFDQMTFTIGDPAGIGSDHPGGANAVFADGHVDFLPNTTDPQTVKNLITPADGQAVPPLGF